MKMKTSKFISMKNSFSLFELILSLLISSTVIIYSTLFIKELIILNNKSLENELLKLQLNSAKIILEKNSDILNQLSFYQNTLYFQNNILLKDIQNYTKSYETGFATITLSLKNGQNLVWKIKL